MSSPLRWAFVAFVIYHLAAPSDAAAFVWKRNILDVPIFWESARIEFWLDDRGAPGVSIDETEKAVVSAMEKWNAVCCSRLRFVYRGRLNGARARFDLYTASNNRNVIVWSPVKRTYFYKDPGVIHLHVLDDGRIVDADIELNGFDVLWTAGVPDNTHHNIENVLVYLLGKALGLDNTSVNGSVLNGKPTAGSTAKTQLTLDDQHGVCTIYPANYDPTCPIGLISADEEPDTDVTTPEPNLVDTNDAQRLVLSGGASCRAAESAPSARVPLPLYLLLGAVVWFLLVKLRRRGLFREGRARLR